MKRWIIALLALAPAPTFAQDAPWVGQLSGRVQNSTTSYVCERRGEQLHCEFTQVLFTPQTLMTAEEVENSISQALQTGFSPEMCSSNRSQLETLKSGGDFGVPLSEEDRANGVQFLELLSDVCDNLSDETVRRVVQAGQDLKARTCNVATLPFTLDFSWNPTTARWESISQPNGTCGVVTSAFFEYGLAPGSSVVEGWTYHQLKTVTNRNGADDPLMGKCADYEDDESWMDFLPRTIKVQCDYLKFSMF